jgi:DNA-binding transcriptional LysR family regulator
MSDKIPHITLEQWAALRAVVDHGGFAPAAEALNKSQSSVSYAIRKLQEQLPQPVLTLNGRKAELTEAGETLLRRARGLLEEAHSIERLATNLAAGWEPEVRLAVEAIFPPELLLTVLGRFADRCAQADRQTRVQVLETVLSGTTEALLRAEADLVITGMVPPGFLGQPLMRVEFIAVARHDHALHRLGRELGGEDLRVHRQLVVRDSGLKRKVDAGWLGAEQRWTVSHLSTSIQALKQGLGFAWVPREHIRAELESGVLKPLPLIEGGIRRVELYLVFADRDSAGPATRSLAELTHETCTAACAARERQARHHEPPASD